MASSSASPAPQLLRFCPLQSCVDVTFWSELGSRKLDEYKLSETPVDISGFLLTSRHEEVGSMLQVLGSSFGGPQSMAQQGAHAVPGRLLLLNTTDALRRLDKAAALQQVGAAVWHDICSGAAEAAPHRLCHFLMLAHADLKHFVFTYWFGFPALKPPQPFQQLAVAPLAAALPGLQQQVCAAADAWRAAPADAGVPSTAGSSSSSSSSEPFCLMRLDTAAGTVRTAGLDAWHELHGASVAADTRDAAAADEAAGAAWPAGVHIALVMFDACHLPLTPGWPLRNALLLAAVRWRCRRLHVLCVRDSSAGRASAARSFALQVELPDIADGWHQAGTAAAAAAAEAPAAALDVPQVLGWEANAQGKLLPRTVDVSALMSPVQLAEQAVDLNLKLMRWRAAPDLDVARLAAARCLLLGAGTLGCAVARTLLAWGVRRLTFVDAACVSYSNPVRQSLYTFDDCLGGGKPKAAAAAEALRAIFPSVEAEGLSLAIPMPGHPPANASEEATTRQAAEQLDALVRTHDAVFLLTDTRESRWLPTLLAAAHGKVAITSALGFDSFLVMRHGLPPAPEPAAAGGAGQAQQQAQQQLGQRQQQQQQQQAQAQLGCYFCNDVVAPLNSTVDRALDQQCTVARPGLAPIAGALAVELLAALLQHPLGGAAPAPGQAQPAQAAAAGAGALGPVPHMVRGQLCGFGQTCMAGRAFSQCTACSPAVVARYRDEGWAFLAAVLQQPQLLEELTGLAELHRQAAALQLDSSSDDDAAAAEGGAGAGSSPDEGDDWTEL